MRDHDFTYQQTMREFYSGIEVFIRDQPKIRKAVEENAALFACVDKPGEARHSMLIDWIIFDYRKSPKSRTVLEEYLDQANLSEEQKKFFRFFDNNVFGLFEVKAVRMGKELLLHDLVGEKEYQVKDTRASIDLARGQCAIVRVLPFADYFILTGQCFPLPLAETPLLRLSFRMDPKKTKTRLNLPDVMKIFAQAGKATHASADKHVMEVCVKAGLKRGEVLSIIQTAREDFLAAGDPGRTVTELVKKMPFQPEFEEKMRLVQQAVTGLWNSWVEETSGPAARKGPIESGLISLCMSYVMQKLKPEDFPNEAAAGAEANRLQKSWLSEPKPEFGGKTPLEAILEEREQLGNPEKRVEFSAAINRLEPGAEIEAKAKELFYSGLNYLQNGNPKKAAGIFSEYIELAPWNHVVWHNLGIAHLLIKDAKQAIHCLEKAIKLKPDYDLAKKNLRLARTLPYRELEKMAKEYRVKVLNEGKEETRDIN